MHTEQLQDLTWKVPKSNGQGIEKNSSTLQKAHRVSQILLRNEQASYVFGPDPLFLQRQPDREDENQQGRACCQGDVLPEARAVHKVGSPAVRVPDQKEKYECDSSQ